MLKDKRDQIISYVKKHAPLLKQNAEALDIYDGNLKPYVDTILKNSLSETYYSAIRDRILPINILQRYVNKVSTTYSKPPRREAKSEADKKFLEYYEKKLSINNSGMLADVFSHLFKGFAWEVYVDKDGNPALRELSFDRFLVMSDSKESPEEETIFIKIMGQNSHQDGSILLLVYTNEEFDAFYMNGHEASEYLEDNQGINLYGTIPYVYGKRQKHKLIPTLDTDMLAITKAISVQLSDMAGALMFSCFPILYGVDINAENLKMSPNAFWSLKSDKTSDKNPQIGVLQPTADSQKVLDFVTNIFILWLETKGIRVGSMGNVSGGNVASGIAKIIDEMDAYEVKKKSMEWFKKDEEELWNKKLPLIHNYFIKSGLVNDPNMPPLIPNPSLVDICVEFETPSPMMTRSEEIANMNAELEIGTISKEMAIKLLHPDYSEDVVSELIEIGDIGSILGEAVSANNPAINDNAIQPSGTINDVQKTALNGAQITSMLEIVQSVAGGKLPKDAGINMLITAFQLTEEDANLIMGASGSSFKIKPIDNFQGGKF